MTGDHRPSPHPAAPEAAPPARPRPSPHPAAPEAAPPARPQVDTALIVGIIALVLAVVGLALNLQPVSLFTGTGTLYEGMVIAAAGLVLAVVYRSTGIWMKVAVGLVAAVCIANTVIVQLDYNHKQDQLRRDLNPTQVPSFSIPSPTFAPFTPLPTLAPSTPYP